MLVVLSVLWGGSFFFVELAVRELPTLTIVLLRVSLAASVLWAAVAVLGRPLPRDASVWLAFLVMGLLNNVVPFGLIVWGQQTIGSGLASILNATTPLFTMAVAALFLADERLVRRKAVGMALGLGGVVAVIGPGALAGLQDNVLAQIACLGGALSYAVAGVFGRRFGRLGVDPVVVAAGQVTGATLILGPAALIVDRPWTLAAPSATTVAAIVGLAVLSTALAYILYFRLLGIAGATNLLLVTFLIPVSAITLGVTLLGESLGAMQIAGLALIGTGLAVIDGRLGGLLRRKAIR
ncbi:hypothetical protein OCGS_1356 [Oceaniovalibus guishaninsula JLT2003]|uniref:EamA domain-containing protein n=2 Tax=Oceaniovalibus TaxID=1207070 RepID=K2HAG4_9RHOB|nr:hypothetical protein OCGS_1356 [Oceaniovalibus guishaninsula JLT2003]